MINLTIFSILIKWFNHHVVVERNHEPVHEAVQIKLNVEHLEQVAHTETGAAVKLSEQQSAISTREAIFALKLTAKVHTLFGFDRKAILQKETS